MNTEQFKAVPEPTLKRLPLYHRFLKEVQGSGKETVSCTDIGAELSLDPTQVRKDLETAGINGRPRVGYLVGNVIEGIEEFLGWKKVNEAFLVGAGSMGAALLGYHKFEECGLKIVAAFDTDAGKIGKRIHGKHVLALEKLPDLADRIKNEWPEPKRYEIIQKKAYKKRFRIISEPFLFPAEKSYLLNFSSTLSQLITSKNAET